MNNLQRKTLLLLCENNDVAKAEELELNLEIDIDGIAWVEAHGSEIGFYPGEDWCVIRDLRKCEPMSLHNAVCLARAYETLDAQLGGNKVLKSLARCLSQ